MGITSVIGVTNHVREGSIATYLLVSIPDMGNADYTGGKTYVKTTPGWDEVNTRAGRARGRAVSGSIVG